MKKISARFTVLFEDPYWIGLYERECSGKYEVCRIIFGSEPKDYEVYDFLMKNWNSLRFSPETDCVSHEYKRINPKRMQRHIKKQTSEKGIGTKAQQALKLQHEQNKKERRTITRQMKEEEKERQFALRTEKRKKKHRGH